MKRLIVIILGLSLLLTGCDSIFDGSYVSVTPHQNQPSETTSRACVANYEQLYSSLKQIIADGTLRRSIITENYPAGKLDQDLKRATDSLMKTDPIANYSVETIDWRLSGQTVLNVEVSYLHTQGELRQMLQVANMTQAEEVLCAALNRCDPDLVMLVDSYTAVDFVVLAENHAMRNPHQVMEMPRITVSLYPETGDSRVVDLNFHYHSNRTMLRSMQGEVQPVFEAASLYVSGSAEDAVKYEQLYSFLMERYDYKIERSITPAYSLLCHGVGDSRAFASVYAAMCREAGLFCRVVSGTYQGHRRYWNLICSNGTYYHMDLLQDSFQTYTDEEMSDYVWDYSAYSGQGVHTQ